MRGRVDRSPKASGELARRIRARGVALVAVVVGILVTAGLVSAAPAVRRIALDMREVAFRPATLYLRAGERVELVIENRGAAEREWSAGRGRVDLPFEKGFRTDLLDILKPRVSGQGYELEQLTASNLDTDENVENTIGDRLGQQVDVAPGGHVVLDFTVPQDAKGMWRMACFLPGHYESGMYGAILIE